MVHVIFNQLHAHAMQSRENPERLQVPLVRKVYHNVYILKIESHNSH